MLHTQTQPSYVLEMRDLSTCFLWSSHTMQGYLLHMCGVPTTQALFATSQAMTMGPSPLQSHSVSLPYQANMSMHAQMHYNKTT